MNPPAGDVTFWHKLRYTPARDWVRGRLSFALDWRRRIDDSGLPAPIRDTVKQVVRRSRLWKGERLDVADELLAHFADGLTAGDTAEQLVHDFGDPARAARLIRRAKKRQRPLAWKGLVHTGQALACLVGVYVLLIGWYAAGSPDVSVNYLAKLNAPARAVPEEERAWPIYREVLLNDRAAHADWSAYQDGKLYIQPGAYEKRFPNPDQPQWGAFAGFVRGQAESLALIRRGASKSGLGLVMKFDLSSYDEKDRLALDGPLRKEETPIQIPPNAWKTHSLWEALLPHLRPMRDLAILVAADMHLAVTEGDGERVLADFTAVLGLARQTNEIPLLICDLVGVSITRQAFEQVAYAMATRPELFTDAQLVALAHRLAGIQNLDRLPLAGEHMAIHDLFQRIYDKNGNITSEGLALVRQLTVNPPDAERSTVLSIQRTAKLPLDNLLMAGRQEITDQYDRLMAMSRRYTDRPLWEQLGSRSQANQVVTGWSQSPLLRRRYWLLYRVFPALDTVAHNIKETAAIRDTLLVAIALEAYHREHDAYPADLAVLTARYLPEPAVDASTGKPMLYKLVDGKPLLYGRGLDGDDDGGRLDPDSRQAKHGGWLSIPDHGDWILFPRPDGQRTP